MTENWKFRRRTFLKHGAQAATLAGLSGLFPDTLRRALVIEPDIRTGTIQDVQHVVILMQENRSFDHYFGHLNGVRGFNDPRALKRQDGKPVWYQNYKYEFSPYHWDTKVTSAQWVSSQNHEWSAFHAIWNQGRNDKWMAVQYPEAMGYFKRGDIPYYYALADAFTLCEAYHQSMMGPTNPNRLYHMSGRAALSGDGKDVHIGNDMGDGTIGASGTVDWTTYPERLSAAGVDWRVYQEGGYRSSSLWYLYVDAYWKYRLQEQNNYDCNALAWFRNFKNAPRDFGPLAARHARPRRRPVAQGCARKHAAAGVLDRRALLLLRASLVGPLVRRVLRDPGARRADQQPRGLGQDRVHPQLRRGRRLL